MSDLSSRLPARPSLEQLRKQAKELLKHLLAGDEQALTRFRAIGAVRAAPTLADAQFVLAREYGFEHWPALVHHVAAVKPDGLHWFDVLAQAVADAYTSGDMERLREVNWTFGTSFYWYRTAEQMRQQLPTWFASSAPTEAEALADARQLVARATGFEGWDALARSVRAPAAPAVATRPASFYRIAPDSPTIGIRGPLADQHWETVVAVMRERRLTGIWAPGASDAALARLSRVEGLTRLYTNGGQLTDDGLRHLARLPALEELSFGGPNSRVTDRGLEVLRELANLTRFWTTWTPNISDAGIANLAHCERLEIVDVMGTHTGDGVLAALAGKPLVRKLSTGRRVTDAGMAMLAGYPRFRAWHDGGIACDVGAFDAEPTHLLLDGPFTDAGLAHLAALEGVFGLNLFWHATGFTAGGFHAIAAMPRLGFLRVDRAAAVTDDALVALSRSRTIESLACNGRCAIRGPGLAALASLPRLRGLTLDCRNVDDASLATLPRFPSLRALTVGGLPDDGYRHVGRCAGLEDLTLPREATDASAGDIAQLPNLRRLATPESKLTDRGLAVLAGMPMLETIDLRGCQGITDAGVRLLATLPGLSTLVLSECPSVTNAALEAFPSRVRIERSGD